jgi:hypothetical protein
MKIKKLSKTEYKIETKQDLIYITKKRNPATKDLYIYFIDIFSNDLQDMDIYWGENFDDFDNVIDYIQDNYNISDNIINQIKL